MNTNTDTTSPNEVHEAEYHSLIANILKGREKGMADLDQGEDTEESFILFSVGGGTFSLPVSAVREIVETEKLARVPNAPDFIRGLMELRDQVVVVIDIRERLSGAAAVGLSEQSRVIICELDGKVTGILADDVSQVLSLPAHRLEEEKKIITGTEGRYMKTSFVHGRQSVVVLEPARLLSNAEMDLVARTGQAHQKPVGGLT